MESSITVEELTKEYNGKLALNNISFDVKKGEIFGYLGPNGAGKSTPQSEATGSRSLI